MSIGEIVELKYLSLDHYEDVKRVMMEVYDGVNDPYWTKEELKRLIELFPDGQVMILVDGKFAGAALSIIIHGSKFEKNHTYKRITGNNTFNTHHPEGDTLYGLDVFIDPQFRGMRLGRRMYDYRKELCEKMNLEKIAFGGRLPLYHQYANEISPKEYIEKVKSHEIHDPVLDFQLSNDFYVKRVLKNYLDGDEKSKDYAVLLVWNNIYYEAKQDLISAENKGVVRMGLVQWQMRPYATIDDVFEQVQYFVDAISGYRSDFMLLPEYWNAPLMAAYNHMSESDAIRELAVYTPLMLERLQQMAVSYNINIISGSMPEIRDGELHNIGYLCRRDGSYERYEKIHVTPDEEKVWGLTGGNQVKAFDTDCGKIGILICYDVEFPELGRVLADEGVNILFVPFLTDTQNAYSRVRHCAQARAIENECYVAIAGSIGNLPKVHNMDISYAQTVVFTPCDFAFPSNGIKAEATPNTEMILVVDVDLNLLKELHEHGAVKNLKNRRKDLYNINWKK